MDKFESEAHYYISFNYERTHCRQAKLVHYISWGIHKINRFSKDYIST